MNQVDQAVQVLKNGGIVIFPTDTVYGIGTRPDISEAVEKIYRIKKTSQAQKFPILVSTIDQVESYAEVTDLAKSLMQKYWPGALTLILKKKGSSEKIGFRMPKSEIVKNLIDRLGVPIIGTSANIHGQKPPLSFEQLDPQIKSKADFVIKGKCKLQKESTVVDATGDSLVVLRQGAIEITL